MIRTIAGLILAAPLVLFAVDQFFKLYDETPLHNVVRLDGALSYGLNEMASVTDQAYANLGINNPLRVRSLEDAKVIAGQIANADPQTMDDKVEAMISGSSASRLTK